MKAWLVRMQLGRGYPIAQEQFIAVTIEPRRTVAAGNTGLALLAV